MKFRIFPFLMLGLFLLVSCQEKEEIYYLQDSKGNYVIRNLVDIAKNKREGFYEYWYNNPVSGKEEPKLAWVKKIPGIDYFIGSGIYLQ